MKLGFVGLGIMGCPMAGNLIRGGHTVYLSTRREVPAELVSAGGIACVSAADVARKSDVIFLMLPDTPDVEAVLFGSDGVAGALTPGKIVVDMSSISPDATIEFAAKISDLKCGYLDAPVSGGEVGAKGGTLSIMVGGNADHFDTVLPLFELLGKNISLVGRNGHGQATKVANQIIVALNIQAVAEALVFAARKGADPEKVRKALLGGFASSRVLEVHGERMVKRTFDPGFRISLHSKDIALAIQSARTSGTALPLTASVQQTLNHCMSLALGDRDHSAIVQAIESMNAISLADTKLTEENYG